MEAVSLSAIYKSASVLLPMGHMANFLGPLFKLLVQEKGPKFLQTIWQNSKLNLASFLETNEINSFVEEYVSGFLFHCRGLLIMGRSLLTITVPCSLPQSFKCF